MRRLMFLPLVIAIYMSSITPDYIFAQGQSVSIYPPVIQVDTTPPASPVVPIVIQNNESETVNLNIQLIPFKTDGKSGQVILTPEELSKGFYPYYQDKIQFLLDSKKTSSIELQPLESKEVDLNINLAKGDPPGDFYYSIVFISSPLGPGENSVSNIPAGIATNLLLTVGPKDRASGGISQFNTSSFKAHGPIDFTLKLHNASSHVINPTGTITVKNMLGRKVGSVKLLPQYVLSRSDRFLVDDSQATSSAKMQTFLDATPQIIWPETFLFGWYEAIANVQLEDNGPILHSSIYFVAFPLYFFFPLVIILFILISIYLRVKRKI